MKTFATVGAAMVIALSMSACVSGVTTANIAAVRSSEPVSETNFVIGEERTAVVGESIVRVKDYVLTRVSVPAVTTETFTTFQLGMNRGMINPGVEYPLLGEREIEGRRIRIVNIGPVSAQIFDDGVPHTKGLVRGAYGEWIEPLPNLTFSESGVAFNSVTRVDESSIAAGENYEIVFTGRDIGSMRFQYREYTSEDMARPAFSQDLSYPVDSSTIRFRGMTIDVIDIGSDSITYKVVSREPQAS